MASGGGRLLFRLVVSAAATLVALALANAWAARYQPVKQLLFQLDDELLHETLPGARRLLLMPAIVGGERVLTELGPEGYRGPALRSPKSAQRVVVAGDSLVLAENVVRRETFVARLGGALAQLSDAAPEMVNAGVSGYGPDQTLLRFERDAGLLDADLCVLVLCANNDFGDLIRNKIFRLDAQGELVRGQYRLHERLREMFAGWEQEAREPALLRLYRSARESRAQEQALAASVGAQRPPYIQEYLAAARGEYQDYASGNPDVYSLFRDYYDVDIALYPAWPSAQEKRRLMRAVLGRFRDLCAERGVEFFVLVVPSAVDLCADFEIRVERERYPWYSPAVLSASYVGICQELGIAHHDLYDDFVAAGPQGLFVGHDDIHWNAAGQALAAGVVAGLIEPLL